jgi:hypothetical protein
MSATQAIRGIAVAAVVVLAVVAAPASATFSGTNGQITERSTAAGSGITKTVIGVQDVNVQNRVDWGPAAPQD